MVNSEYLKNLNEAQKEAVMHLDGPLLIVAGAGSGKTKVLTSRIANIIQKKKAFCSLAQAPFLRHFGCTNALLTTIFLGTVFKHFQDQVHHHLS